MRTTGMNDFNMRLQRIRRSLGDPKSFKITDKVRKDRAIIGTTIPAGEEMAQSGWDKLSKGENPDPAEWAALEVVIRLLRPAPLSRKGMLDDLPEDIGHKFFLEDLKKTWNEFRREIEGLMYSIGRIDQPRGTQIGTGFVVADGVLATNRHVLDELTVGTGMLSAGSAEVNFLLEKDGGNRAEHLVPIEGTLGYHPTLDMALLKIPKSGRKAVPLEGVAAAEGHRVVVIGYPAEDRKRNPFFAPSIFGGDFGYKRGAFGEVLSGSDTPFLFHDCSTLGGNSGSPVFSLSSRKVIGIHSSGFFMYRNEAVNGVGLSEYISTPPV